MQTTIIQYNAGNIRSVYFALKRLGVNAEITDDPDKIKNADRVIFPGVGAAPATMQQLRKNGLDNLIPELQQPVLGICLGMQLMSKFSQEGNTPSLSILKCKTFRFPEKNRTPHMGWNTIHNLKGELFKGIEEGAYMYFVHSYYLPECSNSTAITEYAVNFSAAINRNNFYATQFHPEKSGENGIQILKNFIQL